MSRLATGYGARLFMDGREIPLAAPKPRPMTERGAFLRAVVESPDDDSPRLAFADWLQEQPAEADRLWGEFIAVDLELARLGWLWPARLLVRLYDWKYTPKRGRISGISSPFDVYCRDYTVSGKAVPEQAEMARLLEPGDVIDVEGLDDGVGARADVSRIAFHGVTIAEEPRLDLSRPSATPPVILRLQPCHGTTSPDARIQSLEWRRGDIYNNPVFCPRDRIIARSGEAHYWTVHRRGFVEEIGCPGDFWVQHADFLRACCPIRKVCLTTLPQYEPTGYGECRLPGRRATTRYMTTPSRWQDHILPLLQKEWNGVEFDPPRDHLPIGQLGRCGRWRP